MITRRACLKAGPAALLAPAAVSAQEAPFDPSSPLPHKAAFAPLNTTYLNSASQHPVSLGARKAVQRYLDYKSFAVDSEFSNFGTYMDVLEKYARLINADSNEVTYVQSTTVGENLVMKALGLPYAGAKVVTEELHYVGSLPTYAQLADRGVEVVTVRATDDGRIPLEDFERAIDEDTTLVTVSAVSMVNGFQHDLEALCEIAHARGTLVFADLVQAVGSVPIDVKQSGVDFCSAASYKWLMGEQGLGFIYARNDRLAEIERPWFGHYQLASRADLGFPNPERGASVTDFEHIEGARGYFAMGSQPNIIAALLDHSLDYLHAVGVERIQAYRQPLIDRLQEEITALGLSPLTPGGTRSAIVSFRHDGDARALRDRLHAANVTVTVGPHHLRVSPSVFNDMQDVERLIEALS